MTHTDAYKIEKMGSGLKAGRIFLIRKAYVFRRPRITADHEFAEAASGAGSLILSKTCRGRKF